jgi:hypothetical protein
MTDPENQALSPIDREYVPRKRRRPLYIRPMAATQCELDDEFTRKAKELVLR